jgi:hypothetical protein
MKPATKPVVFIDMPEMELFDEPGGDDFELTLDLSFDSATEEGNDGADGDAVNGDANGDSNERVEEDLALEA